ncbi:hypothetical protein RhiTH_009360 [Rhizoctonia solani]
MATRSRPPSQARSPVDQGQLGPDFPPASPELGKRTLSEQTKINQEVHTNAKNISQAVNVIKDGLAQLQQSWGPHTPEDQKPPAVEETPWAAPKAKPIGKCPGHGHMTSTSGCMLAQAQNLGVVKLVQFRLVLFSSVYDSKAQPFLGAPAPILSTGAPRRNPLTLFNPYPSSSFPLGPAPATQGPPPAPIVTLAQPPAPSTVKVDHPKAFKGKIGLEAKQWLTCMLAWVRLNQRQFPTDLEVLSFLLMNMTEAGGAWAHPHLDQLGSHRVLIQTMDKFKVEFLAAFGNPDATQAAERKITSLTQTGTCAKYICHKQRKIELAGIEPA